MSRLWEAFKIGRRVGQGEITQITGSQYLDELRAETTPKNVALNLVEEHKEMLVLVPCLDDGRDIEWEYIWLTEDTAKWAEALQEFLLVSTSPVEAKKP